MRTKQDTKLSKLTDIIIMSNAMPTISEVYEAFETWISDGNVVESDGYWCTQEELWCNKIESKSELFIYFIKEYYYEFI